jgi:cytochrome c oxidase assembly protein subunit 15
MASSAPVDAIAPPERTVPAPEPASRAVAIWIFSVAAMVLAMVVVGGVTRLTRSGLSIVEWKPVTGALPPMGEQAWLAEFAKYQASPEYLHVNHGMTLDGFKSIFLVEWFHRLLGRLVGVVTFVPLIFFAVRKRLGRRRATQLGVLFVLGGLQGALGWFMVKSGLVDVPRVSPYRLTAHLLMALGIFCGLIWAGLDELGALDPSSAGAPSPARPRRLAAALTTLTVITIAWGGFMAGLHAGHVAPTFPTMNGSWIPGGMLGASPGLATPFENAITVHFLHRLLAYATATLAIVAAVAALRAPGGGPFRGRAHAAAYGVLAIVALQITLGALTVLWHVPVWLATWHQGNGALLLGLSVALVHATTHAARSARAARVTEGERFAPDGARAS